jgi:hypothetical protein
MQEVLLTSEFFDFFNVDDMTDAIFDRADLCDELDFLGFLFCR